MYDYVHIDKKCFYLTKKSRRFYLGKDELPVRKTKGKRFVTKVMFLAAVARPWWDNHENRMFDKI